MLTACGDSPTSEDTQSPDAEETAPDASASDEATFREPADEGATPAVGNLGSPAVDDAPEPMGPHAEPKLPPTSKPEPTLSLRVLTYNVAGLPEGISGSMPSIYTAQISPLLNAFDLVGVQEDFSYHAELISRVDLPHTTAPAQSLPLGDGLNLLSRSPILETVRVPWEKCAGVLDSGSDCLTPKGFMRTRIAFLPNMELDVYDLHTDAGSDAPSVAARADNLRQLGEAVQKDSVGRAVIMLGDFNERFRAEGGALHTLVGSTALADAWTTLFRNGALPAPGSDPVPCSSDPNDPSCERIDKVLFRDGPGILLSVGDYAVEGLRFATAAGQQLSDHRPVSVRIDVFTTEPQERVSASLAQ
jgi:endonuclease/exonuclease/phosphatase family metal-dependent hydrolase